MSIPQTEQPIELPCASSFAQDYFYGKKEDRDDNFDEENLTDEEWDEITRGRE